MKLLKYWVMVFGAAIAFHDFGLFIGVSLMGCALIAALEE
jgi:hypothetical protein